MAEQFDVVVIGGGAGGYAAAACGGGVGNENAGGAKGKGGGPGGYAAALYGAGIGMNIAVVEKEKVGGTCLHRGCIPAKEFLETATVFRTVAGAKEFGIQASQPTVEFGTSQARKQKVVDQLWKGLAGLMKQRKITTVIGTGSLSAGHLVRVDDGSELVGRHV